MRRREDISLKNENNQNNLTQKRWLVLIASCLINLCIGAMYAWSVFAAPLAAHLSELLGATITAADLSIVFSVGNGGGFITMIAGGFLNKKIGPKWVIFIGGILFGSGFIVCGLANSIFMLILGFGIMSGLAMGLAYGQTISNSVKFFPDKAGLVGGIATASYGISSVIIPPVANKLINIFGVSKAFLILGIAIVVIVGIFSQFIIKCPEGFKPDGWKGSNEKVQESQENIDKTWKEMLKMPVFYVMIIMLFFGAVFGMMAISQASGIAQNMIGMAPAQAAIVVSVLALFNTCGRIVAGYVSDRIGCINTLTIVFVIAIISMGLLYFSSSSLVIMFYIGICLTGVCFGAFMGVYPGFTASQFGSKNSGVNYGIMFMGFSSAGVVGPMIVSKVYNSTGDYRFAFLIAIVFAIIGMVLSFVYRKVSEKSK